MTQPAPVPDASKGLADSDDLFAFDEVVAASSTTTRSPLDPEALIEAFDEPRDANATAAASAAPAVDDDAAAAPAPEAALPVQLPLPRTRRGWTIAALAVGGFALCNIGLVWFALHDASDTRQQMSELSASVLELARRATPPVAPAPQPIAHETASPAPAPERSAPERAPALPDYDPDPRREREFAAIEGLLAQRQFGEARRQAYQVLARCDELNGVTREAVESRAAYLLARALGAEAAQMPAPPAASTTPSTEAAR